MRELHALSALLAVSAVCAWVNHRFIKLPAAIGVMAVSLAFSMGLIAAGYVGVINISWAAAFIGAFDFEDLVLHGMLAFLLFAGGLSIQLGDLNAEKGVVALLSSLGVVISTCLTGFLFWIGLGWLGINIPFAIALLFGAISSPTDAVAALGILRKVGAPKSLEIKLVGESLFNDGIGVVVFFAVAAFAFGQEMSGERIALTLFIEVVGGTAMGGLLGYVAYRMLRAVDDYVVEILITLALAGGGYSLAEHLHVSAPICVVVAGLIIGNQGRAFAMSEQTREHLDTFWELVDELLNAVLFVLIGLEIVLLTVDSSMVSAGLIAIGVILLSRLVAVWIPIAGMRRFRSFSPHIVKILAWGGLRGGISVALALSLPPSAERNLLIVCTYIVVLFSVLVQGTTLPRLLRYAQKCGSMQT